MRFKLGEYEGSTATQSKEMQATDSIHLHFRYLALSKTSVIPTVKFKLIVFVFGYLSPWID
jgi:hypothetical protein